MKNATPTKPVAMDTNTQPELLPCPFCRSSAEIARDSMFGRPVVDVVCTGCHAAVLNSADASTATERWNTRAGLATRASSPAVPSEAVEKAVEVLELGYLTMAQDEALKVLKSALDHVSRSTWVRVEDGLPSDTGEYLVTKRRSGEVCIRYLNVDEESTREYIRHLFVAWMPLPSPFIADRKGDER